MPQADIDFYLKVLQLTDGLAYLHSQKVVHGDLKASNLLISCNKNVLICDFGLSKLMGKGMTTASSKKGAGSVHWMAPELLFSDNPIKTFSSDVYAYGITISEIIRGELPFIDCTNHLALINAIIENKRPPRMPTDSPQGRSYTILWDVASDCWAPEPSIRPTMEDICSRFSLKPISKHDDVISSGVISPSAATVGYASGPSIRNVNLDLSHFKQQVPFDAAAEARLLQLLGDADYGDVGYTREDGLCLDGTRVEILDRLDAWADSQSSPKAMLLKGQTGRGTSAIARSAFSRFRNRWGDDAPSAIFHFRRGNEAVDNRSVLALAHQLGRSANSGIKSAILGAVQAHEDVAKLRLEEQFDILLVQPFRILQSRVLIVIDALDECSNLSVTSGLLRLIGRHTDSLPPTVKFLLSSRPQDHVVKPFKALCGGSHEDLDAVDLALIDHDVRSYFLAHLSRIQVDYGLDETWVSGEVVRELVSLSQGLFQWAHAAVEYVRERPSLHLQQLVRSSNVVVGLPALYRQILSTAFPQQTSVRNDALPALIRHVIGLLTIAPFPVEPSTLTYLWDDPEGLSLVDPAGEICEGILGRLGSMLILPQSPNEPIHFMHTSVRDFFTDKEACTDPRFLIDPTAQNAELAALCFRRMKRDLKQAICEVGDPSTMNSGVIPVGMGYCCAAWAIHLSKVRHEGRIQCMVLHGQLDEFCVERLLYWLEALSETDALWEVFGLIRQVKGWVEKTEGAQFQPHILTSPLLSDLESFCRRFFDLISVNAQHLSLSYLPHFPKDSELRRIYDSSVHSRGVRIVRGPVNRGSRWSKIIPTKSPVSRVAFWPNSKTISSSLDDDTVRFWDVDTGEEEREPISSNCFPVDSIAFSSDMRTIASGSDQAICLWDVEANDRRPVQLAGHENLVRSLAFSPDGKTLASRSYGENVLLWDVVSRKKIREVLLSPEHAITRIAFSPDNKTLALASFRSILLCDVNTRKQTGALIVGQELVESVAFSPDGKTLASGSDDQTIRLWDIDSKEETGDPLVGHSGSVSNLAFSPCGKILASGSDDETVRLWDIVNGKELGEPLVGHQGPINSVAFSPDAAILASGSSDETIRLWGIDCEEQKEEQPIGHNTSVGVIAFSPDGRTFASGSDDHTLRLWDVRSGEQKGKQLIGHSASVLSVTFSPNGKTLASGSEDMSIRLWDVDTGAETCQPLVDHEGLILSVTFSPDGKTLASGSYDNTIRLWDLDTGEQKGHPLVGHTGSVLGLVFSPDKRLLASGSRDKTIRIWDIDSGKQQGVPLVGHAAAVLVVAFSPDSRMLASGSNDRNVCLWDIITREQIGEPLEDHFASVSTVNFSPDGGSLVSHSAHDTFCWNIESRKVDQPALPTHGSPDKGEVSQSFSPKIEEPEIRIPANLSSYSGEDSEPPPIVEIDCDSTSPERGWIWCRGKMCTWVPEEFYLGTNGRAVEISLFAGHVIFHHPNIYILDISAFL